MTNMVTRLDNNCSMLHNYNEHTKVQNPSYKDVTLNAYTSAHTKKLNLKSIIIVQRVGILKLVNLWTKLHR